MNTEHFLRPSLRFGIVVPLLILLLTIPFGARDAPSPVSAQTPTPPTLFGLSGSTTGATTATVTIFLTNPDSVSTTVYLRHGRGGVFGDAASIPTSGARVEHNLTGLNPGTVYSVQAALTNEDPFVADVSATVSSGTPAISTVADSEVDHNSAKITVTVNYPNSSTVNLRYKRTADPDPVEPDDPDPYVYQTAQTTTETDDSQALVFNLSGLASSTGYTVQASFQSNFSSGVVSDTFTTTAPPSAITGISVPDASRLHNSAKISITVSNAASGGTTVYYQYKKNSDANYPSTTPPTLTATSASPSPEATLSGLDANTQYNVRASLESDFSSGIVTQNFTTRSAPSVSSVSVGTITHGTAKATVNAVERIQLHSLSAPQGQHRSRFDLC